MLTLEHNHIHSARWRSIQVPLQDLTLRKTQAALMALDKLEEELAKQQRSAAQPKAHQFELVPTA